jgi:hypothetical protein
METQCTSNILMIRPRAFGFNEETALSNVFMENAVPSNTAQVEALVHFDAFVEKLTAADLNVLVEEDCLYPRSPDSIFPNNWVSFHNEGKVILYPMEAENRRTERREVIIQSIKNQFYVEGVIDLSNHENQGYFLEGTGSLVLDRINKIAYASSSTRTNCRVLNDWQKVFPHYEIICFNSEDSNGIPIYHTNVMMCVAEDFSVICAESIKNKMEHDFVLKSLIEHGKEPLLISFEQMNEFAGNMLQVVNRQGKRILVMSQRAYNSLKPDQIAFLENKTEILAVELGLIETLGGGSARCMLAEIHLTSKK